MAEMLTTDILGQAKDRVKGYFSPMMWLAISGIAMFFWDKFDLGSNPAIKNAFSGINKTLDGLKRKVFGLFNKELNTARDEIMERTDALNGVGSIDADFGVTGVSERVRELSMNKIDDAFDPLKMNHLFSMSKPGDILTSMQELRGEIANEIVRGLKEQNKNYTADDEQRYNAAAQARAAAITGATDKVGNNPNILDTGLGGLLNQFYKAVEPEGDYVKGSAGKAPIDQTLIEQARVLLSGNIKSGAAAASTPAASGAAQGR